MKVANSADLVCRIQQFAYLLKKIGAQAYQEKVVENGIGAVVFENRTECLGPLLSALNEGSFLNKEFGDGAIRRIFLSASLSPVEKAPILKNLFDNSAISAEYYSIALYNSYMMEDQTKELFHWLLARADRRDLEDVMEPGNFSRQTPEYQDAVNKASKDDNLEVRIGIRERKIAIMKELEKYIPPVLAKFTFEHQFG